MTVLRIDSSAQQTGSISREVTDYLVDQLVSAQPNRMSSLVRRDLAQHEFPVVHGDDVMAIYSGSNDPTFKEHLAWSETLTAELLDADVLVLGVSMYNFGIPSYLKQWIDYVCRAGITFSYTDQGPKGLTQINDVYVVTATGGVPVGSDVDFASRYIEQVCRFLGANRVHHIDAGGSKQNPEAAISKAKKTIDQLGFSKVA